MCLEEIIAQGIINQCLGYGDGTYSTSIMTEVGEFDCEANIALTYRKDAGGDSEEVFLVDTVSVDCSIRRFLGGREIANNFIDIEMLENLIKNRLQ